MSKAKGDVIWEAVEFLKNKDTIEGIPVFCFENLLALKKGETYQECKLKNLMKNKGLIFRKTFVNDDDEEESKMVFVECVKKYYDLPAKCDNCNSITENYLEIGDSYSISNCIECHKRCLDMFKRKEITKK